MPAVRSLLARVQKLEHAGQTAFGWIDEFVTEAEAGIASGAYEPRDMAVVIACVQKWRRDRIWELWQ